jgi:hypothetical protein
MSIDKASEMVSGENEFICPACHPYIDEIGEVVPCVWLGFDRKAKKYVLVSGIGGGCNYTLHYFKKEPRPEPFPKNPGETEDHFEKRYNAAPKEVFEADTKWVSNARMEMNWPVAMDMVMEWASMIKAGGWKKRDGAVSIWLYSRCALLVAKHKKG